MEKVNRPQGVVRFGVFEVDFRAEELRKRGVAANRRQSAPLFDFEIATIEERQVMGWSKRGVVLDFVVFL